MRIVSLNEDMIRSLGFTDEQIANAYADGTGKVGIRNDRDGEIEYYIAPRSTVHIPDHMDLRRK